MWQIHKKQLNALTTCCALLLAGCGGRSKKSDAALVSSKVVFDEHEKNAILSGISKRCATSSLLLQELGELCIDIPIPLDIFDLVSVKPKCVEQGICLKPRMGTSRTSLKPTEQVRQDVGDVNGSDGLFGEVLSSAPQATAQFSYKTYKSAEDLIAFYLPQMERFGWQFDADFRAEETLLLFNKPDKRAAISIRVGKKYCSVVVFVS